MLLARTCFLSGQIKADLYYNKAIKYFPNNVSVLYELAMLKNTNQLLSASDVLEKIYKIDFAFIINKITSKHSKISKE